MSTPGLQNVSDETKKYSPGLEPHGCCIRQCELCGEKINQGKSLRGGHFEGHRNSKSCRKTQRALIAQRKTREESYSKVNRIQKYFSGTAKANFIKEPTSSDRTQVESEPMLVGPSNSFAVDDKQQELTPADANLLTLAYDVRRALADITGVKK